MNKITGHLPLRSWCRENYKIFSKLQKYPQLRSDATRFWEYPFVYRMIRQRTKVKDGFILDIGGGDGSFAKVLSDNYTVAIADNYDSPCWKNLDKNKDKDLTYITNDCRNLNDIKDELFDITLLISVIEHVPSNTIFCEKRGMVKNPQLLASENKDKLKAIDEALRVTKKGGIVIITTDVYLDYPDDMNISWKELLGLEGFNRDDMFEYDQNIITDMFLIDNPIHKGRVLPICITIEK